jgi:predicted ArsR family transcriptional regulator
MTLSDSYESKPRSREQAQGLVMSDLFSLPDEQRNLLSWMMRRQAPASLAEVAGFLGIDEPGAKAQLDAAIERGQVRQVEVDGRTAYRVRSGSTRPLPQLAKVWDALDDGKDGGQKT